MTNYSLKEIKIEVTQKCPLNCLHCSSEANISKTTELTKTQVIQLTNDAKSLGAQEVTISGGEPLLWTPLSEVIKHCSEINLPLTVYTTGTPLYNNDELKNSLIGSGLKNVIVSLYSANKEIHESITRIYGSFDKTVSVINELISNNVSVSFHFVAMRPNYSELAGVVDYAGNVGVKKVSVLRFVPHGRGSMVKDFFSLDRKQLDILRKDIIRLSAKQSLVKIRVGSPFNILLINDNVFCMAASDRAIVSPNGKIFPCDAFKNIEQDGKMISLEEGNLVDIWYNSDYLTLIRNELSKGTGDICSSCKFIKKCKGGCLAQKLLRIENGSSLQPDPDCLLQR